MISSFTFVCDIPREFNSGLQNALNRLDFKPTLAFGFISVEFPLTNIMDIFQSHGITLFGATSAGVISFKKDEDILLDKGAVFVLTDIPKDAFQLQLLKMGDLAPEIFGNNIGEIVKQSFKSPSVMIAFSGLDVDIQAVIDGTLTKAGKHLNMVGCLAGDDLKFKETFVFTENDITENGVAFLILDGERFNLQSMTTSGWNGLGTDFTITRSSGTKVLEIDGNPALDVYTNYLNISEDDLPMIGLEYPLTIRNPDGTTSFRTITKIDKQNRAIIFSSSALPGTVFSFSASPGFEILEKTREKVIQFHERHQDTDLMILYSAVAREMAIGPLISTEIKLAAIKWKVPLAGCFSYGEIANDYNNPCKFYNQSFTLAILTEKPVHTS